MDSVLALYTKIDDPVKAADQLGVWLSQSQMMGAITAQQGKLLAFDILARGVPITEPILMYYVVANRLTMKADVMLSEFNAAGGKHRIIENTSEAAEILLIDGEDQWAFRITWEEAKQEPWPYGKDGKTLKPTWAGPVGRADMLWARVISRGVRKVKPSVVSGRYTPEEIQDLPEYVDAISQNGNGKAHEPVDVEELLKANASRTAAANPIKPPVMKAGAADEPATGGVPSSEPAPAVLAEKDATSQAVAATASSTPSQDGYATGAQVTRIVDLYVALEVPVEAQEKALKSRGAATLRSLKFDQAAELLAKLEAKHAAAEASRLPPNLTSCPTNAPCDQTQIDAIVRMVKEIAERDPGFPAKYKARLQAQGKQRTADLNGREADAMLGVLGMENLSLFFEHSLEQLVEQHDERLAIQAQQVYRCSSF